MIDLSYYNWKIRNSIIPEERINEYLYLDFDTIYNLNCYAYAIGATFPSKGENEFYTPGFTEGLDWHNIKTDQELIDLLMLDFKNLKIDHRFIEKGTKNIKLVGREYLVKVFKTTDESTTKDFHFIRKNKDGLWYEKLGWYKDIKKVGETKFLPKRKLGSEIDDFILKYDLDFLEYKEVGYFALAY